jgi:hypothetical protein
MDVDSLNKQNIYREVYNPPPNRIYYAGPDTDERISLFHKNANHYFDYLWNPLLHIFENPTYGENNVRILSWNVRYFTEINDTPNLDIIRSMINEINPDIICFQEATLGWNKYYDKTIFCDEHNELLVNYKLISFCWNVPSWYADLYGNAMSKFLL